MGVFGEMFGGRRISDESGEDGDGRDWEFGPIDLDNGTITLRPTRGPAEPDGSSPVEDGEGTGTDGAGTPATEPPGPPA